MQKIDERGDRITFYVEVSVASMDAEAFAEAITGDDDDIMLAAEEAMRSRLDGRDETELLIPDNIGVKDALRRFGQANFHL